MTAERILNMLKGWRVYEYIATGQFPRPVPLTGKAVAWVSTEIDRWISDRIQQRDQVSA